jgi:hypothetical protein
MALTPAISIAQRLTSIHLEEEREQEGSSILLEAFFRTMNVDSAHVSRSVDANAAKKV